MVNTIRFRFDLTRFRKAFPVCNILTIRYTSRKKPQNAFFLEGKWKRIAEKKPQNMPLCETKILKMGIQKPGNTTFLGRKIENISIRNPQGLYFF